MAGIPPEYQAAFQRWGYLADAEAKKWGLPNGATLLAKVGYVETRFSRDLGITSSAGARGPMQFMPATRDSFLRKYGVDAWGGVDGAVHAAAIFLRTLGLDSYNPGSSTYIRSVLSAPVSSAAGGGARDQAARALRVAQTGPDATSGGIASSLMKFLLTIVLVGGGVVLIGLGVSRTAGAGQEVAA